LEGRGSRHWVLASAANVKFSPMRDGAFSLDGDAALATGAAWGESFV